MNPQRFIEELLRLWMEEKQQQGTVVIERKPPTELQLLQAARKTI